MSLTITIPGAVNVTTGATAPATLTIGVGVPGATGPAGAAGAPGQGVPTGGTAGQFLTKIDGTNYNTDWTTVNLSQYLTISNAAATYQPLSGMSSYLTTASAASTYQTQAGMSSYLTSSTAASTYAPIASGQPSNGTIGQFLVKNSGTAYDSSWTTVYLGDRYLTSSTTSLTIGTGAKTLTVGTGLSYSSQQDIVIAYDASNHMHAVVTSYNSSTGALVVDVQNKTGSGTYTSWVVNVGGTVPLQSVNWGEIVGTLGNQTDLATALNAKLETSTAASTYAALAGATFTGEVATPASTTSSAGFSIAPGVAPTTPTNGEIWNSGTDILARLSGVSETLARQSWVTSQLGSYLTTASAASTYQTIAGMSSYLTTSAASTTYAALAGATFTGLVSTPAATTASAFLRVAHGAAPTTPVNGDIWTTTSGLFARINGGTQQYAPLGSTNTFTGTNTFSGGTLTFGNATGASTVNISTGATATATTKAVNIGTAGLSGSTTNIAIGSAVAGSTSTTTIEGTLTANGTTLNLGTSTAAATYNLGTGATLTATTKAVNIGTNGVAGSTTNIAIGSTTGTSTTTLQGATNGVTLAQNTNTTGLATTAFVLGQASSTTPAMDGTAAVGTGTTFARADHVHPTDTTRAPLASPTFTGVPAAPTAAANTNTTQLATTAYVVGQAATVAPLIDGTAAVGTSLLYARQDHVHPTDTSRAPLASPALTGVPTAPTATAGTNTTQIATTAFVTAAIPAFATNAQTQTGTSTTLAVNPAGMMSMLLQPEYRSFDMMIGNVTANVTGAAATALHSFYQGVYTTGASGKSMQTMGVNNTYFTSRGKTETVIDWTKQIWIKTRSHYTGIGVAGQDVSRFCFGKTSATVGDLAERGIGYKHAGGGSNFFLMVHNGTTLTTVDTGVNPSSLPGGNFSAFDVTIYSDGAGNVTLWIDDVQKATTTAGPSTGTSTSPRLTQEVENLGTYTSSIAFVQSGTKTYFGV